MSIPTPHLVGGGFAYEQDDDWAKVPEGYEFPEAAGVDVDEDDNLFVFNRGPHPVLVFDKNGNFLRSFGEETFTARAHGIHISPDGFCYLIDDSQHCVHKFDMSGKLIWTLGESGKPAPKWSGEPFNRPTHVAISPKSGDIYVTDGYGNSRVHRYDGNGKHIVSWGQVGTDPGEFCNPHNVIVDEDENIYVADRENNRVQVFDNQGHVQAIWHDIYKADGFCRDKAGTFYVGELVGMHDTNTLGHRISIHSKDGTRLARLGSGVQGDGPGEFNAIHGCAADSQGNLYMAEVSYTMRGRREDPPKIYKGLRRLKKA
jgi:DNA-binding beta-propeller fold protein YncE